MSIPCPGCGRDYDVTLFQFGRTITCTCGARVGHGHLLPRLALEGAPRFLADAMLGRLARWLRAIGLDTAYEVAAEDRDLVRRAWQEGRVLLTRDRRLPREWTVPAVYLPEPEVPIEQLAEVVEGFDLDWRAGMFTRCLVCNTPFQPAPETLIQERVPHRVRRHRTRFARCPVCDQLFWEGSHTERMRRRLAERLGSKGIPE
jgi:uncharacterized protein